MSYDDHLGCGLQVISRQGGSERMAVHTLCSVRRCCALRVTTFPNYVKSGHQPKLNCSDMYGALDFRCNTTDIMLWSLLILVGGTKVCNLYHPHLLIESKLLSVDTESLVSIKVAICNTQGAPLAISPLQLFLCRCPSVPKVGSMLASNLAHSGRQKQGTFYMSPKYLLQPLFPSISLWFAHPQTIPVKLANGSTFSRKYRPPLMESGADSGNEETSFDDLSKALFSDRAPSGLFVTF